MSDEMERLKTRELIAHDDHTASCTAAGWLAQQRHHARAQLEPDDIVPNASYWVARLEDDPDKTIDIECERWVDARAFAVAVSGGREIIVEPSCPIADRWQVKYAGSALDPTNGLHMVARKLTNATADGPFLPIRELTFG